MKVGAGGGQLFRQHGLALAPCLAAGQMDQRRGGRHARKSDHEEEPDHGLGFGGLPDGIGALGHGAGGGDARQQRQRGETGDRQGAPGRGGPYRDEARYVPWPPR